MRFPDVSELGPVHIEGRKFLVFLVAADWEMEDADHDSDHARGVCECPCSSPVDLLMEAAEAGQP